MKKFLGFVFGGGTAPDKTGIFGFLGFLGGGVTEPAKTVGIEFLIIIYTYFPVHSLLPY